MISQSAVGACPCSDSAMGCWSTTRFLGGLDVETCPFPRTYVSYASTAFCEALLPEGLHIRMQLFLGASSAEMESVLRSFVPSL